MFALIFYIYIFIDTIRDHTMESATLLEADDIIQDELDEQKLGHSKTDIGGQHPEIKIDFNEERPGSIGFFKYQEKGRGRSPAPKSTSTSSLTLASQRTTLSVSQSRKDMSRWRCIMNP